MEQRKRAVGIPAVQGRAATAIVAAALAASCALAPAAFAQDATASVGKQAGSGATDITIQLKNQGVEVGGAGTEGNPDADNDGYGDNIAFSVPTSINFVADSQGVLTGPRIAEMQNHSSFSIHGSSLKVDAEEGWNIVSDAAVSTATNSIDFQIGPSRDMLNASDYLQKKAVSNPAAWNIAPTGGIVALSTSGDINNVSADISAATKVATLHWYVTPGSAS